MSLIPSGTPQSIASSGKRRERGGCGGRIRTDDLRVMSPTSFHCSTPPSEDTARGTILLGGSASVRRRRGAGRRSGRVARARGGRRAWLRGRGGCGGCRWGGGGTGRGNARTI